MLQIKVVWKDDVHVSLVCVWVCVIMLDFRGFSSRKTHKNIWSSYCLLRVRKSYFHILLEREEGSFLYKAQNGWLCDTSKSRFQPSLAHAKWNNILTNLFQKLYPPLHWPYFAHLILHYLGFHIPLALLMSISLIIFVSILFLFFCFFFRPFYIYFIILQLWPPLPISHQCSISISPENVLWN